VTKRKRLTLAQKHELLMDAGYHCGNPRCPVILAVHILEDHHIIHVSEGDGNELSNRLALCPMCHTLYHAKEISREAMRCVPPDGIEAAKKAGGNNTFPPAGLTPTGHSPSILSH
jgi:HNH endonuclease